MVSPLLGPAGVSGVMVASVRAPAILVRVRVGL